MKFLNQVNSINSTKVHARLGDNCYTLCGLYIGQRIGFNKCIDEEFYEVDCKSCRKSLSKLMKEIEFVLQVRQNDKKAKHDQVAQVDIT